MKPKMDNLEWVAGRLSLPPVSLRVVDWQSASARSARADATVEATWEGQTASFSAEIKQRSIPKLLREAIAKARETASPPETYPLVIVPYLSPDKLSQLEAEGVSGVDLCGNGVLSVPGKILVVRSGKPNQFPESPKLKNAYRGANSLVARAFLMQPRFSKVKDIAELLEQRGDGVALSTVSKALKRLEDDLVVTRDEQIRLAQPDVLLDRLAANYEPPSVKSQFVGKSALEPRKMARLMAAAGAELDGKVVVTGAASAEQYAAMAREPLLSVYTTLSPGSLMDASGIEANETQRFANLEIIQTSDLRVFSDARGEDGVPYASPVQAYLELATGDKRQKDAATQVRSAILASLRPAREDERP